MSGLAVLARQKGHEVTGSDSCIRPKILELLEDAGVKVKIPFSIKNLESKPELVIVGNELYPDNEELAEVRQRAMPYISGSLWLEEYVLNDKWSLGTTLKEIQKNVPETKPVKHSPKPLPETNTKLKQRITR